MNESDGRQPDKVSALLGMNVDEYLDADQQAHHIDRESAEYKQAVRGIKAWMLAPNVFLYDALMDSERVPWKMLRPDQARRYGLRQRTRDRRYGLAEFNDVRR